MSQSTAEIRQAFLDFFHEKGHQVIESSSLVPDNDPTLLFTNAGMNQFKDVFLGLENRPYQRATTSQCCLRAGGKHNDLENVGYTERHHTFFEMLGNFSFGDYFKYEAIRFAWELLTSKKWFNLNKEKLWVTVYAGDDETYNIWVSKIGFPAARIIRIGDNKGTAYASDNFWKMGDTGCCGPCSEIFYDHGGHIWGGLPGSTEEGGDRYIEIWNLVFMQFNRQEDGTLLPLPTPSIDTGMGLERIAAVLQGVSSSYHIDLFKRLIDAAAKVIGTSNPNNKSLRVIADHIRSCAFLVSAGILPSNEGRGYVLRRIIRRAIRHGNMLGASGTFFCKLVTPLIEVMGSAAFQLQSQKAIVERVLRAEEEQFSHTLQRGLALLDKKLTKLTGNILDGETAFRLHDTYGFPLDLTADVCRENSIRIDESGFRRAMEVQRKRARESNGFCNTHNNLYHMNLVTSFFGYEQLEHQGKVIAIFCEGRLVEVINQGNEAIVILDETSFYAESGGQIGDQGELKAATGFFEVSDTKKYGRAFGHLGRLRYGKLKTGDYVTGKVNSTRRKCICINHSATHLLHAALRHVLGEHVQQKGSLVTDGYLRFDFIHNVAMNPDQMRLIEDIVNEQIRANFFIKTNILTLEDARNKGATALFGEKYGEKVRVLSIGDTSIELCGGTHANRTGDIGLFRIMSECGTAANTRRIEAITGKSALSSLHQQNDLIGYLAHLVKGDRKTLVDKVLALQGRARELERELQIFKNKQIVEESALLLQKVRKVHGTKLLVSQIDTSKPKMLRAVVEELKQQIGSGVIVLSTVFGGRVNLIVGITEDLTDRIAASKIINYLAQQFKGKGGGRPDLAEAGGGDASALPTALESIDAILAEKLRMK